MKRKKYIAMMLCLSLLLVVPSVFFIFDKKDDSRLKIILNEGDFDDDGRALKLKLKKGSVKEIAHIYADHELNNVLYKPIGRIAKLRMYLVQAIANEASLVIFYDDVTGKELGIVEGYLSKIRFSPSGKYMVYADSDDSGYTFQGIQVFDVAPGLMKRVFLDETGGFKFVEFEGDESFVVRSEPPFQSGESVKEYVVFKNQETGSWQIAKR